MDAKKNYGASEVSKSSTMKKLVSCFYS